MKTQKYISIVFMGLYLLTTACSSHPEIKPYEAPQELAVDDSASSQEELELPDMADGFVEDAELPVEAESSADIAVAKADAPVEEETPKAVSKKETAKDRAPASTLKNGYYTLSEDCEMRSSPKSNSSSVGSVSKGKKLWLDAHNGSWLKAYKKKGTAYIPAHCVK